MSAAPRATSVRRARRVAAARRRSRPTTPSPQRSRAPAASEREDARMETVIYGIRNCDTMKKALAWLAGEGIAVQFHDYRKDGVDEAALRAWCAALGRDALINRRGTTWRKLSPEQ